MTLQHVIKINRLIVPVLASHTDRLIIESPVNKGKDVLFLRSGKVLYRDATGKFNSVEVRI